MTLAQWMADHPHLSYEWDESANIDLSPDTVSHGSKKRAFWVCEAGHKWQAAIYARTGGGKNCPYCSNRRVLEGFNDLKTTHPQLADEWCEELNGDLTPAHVTGGSHKRVWWKCESGHVWQAYVFARTKENGTTCPICSGRFKKNQ